MGPIAVHHQGSMNVYEKHMMMLHIEVEVWMSEHFDQPVMQDLNSPAEKTLLSLLGKMNVRTL